MASAFVIVMLNESSSRREYTSPLGRSRSILPSSICWVWDPQTAAKSKVSGSLATCHLGLTGDRTCHETICPSNRWASTRAWPCGVHIGVLSNGRPRCGSRLAMSEESAQKYFACMLRSHSIQPSLGSMYESGASGQSKAARAGQDKGPAY
eukprot:1308549-Pyramimonas_sp.AAC.1